MVRFGRKTPAMCYLTVFARFQFYWLDSGAIEIAPAPDPLTLSILLVRFKEADSVMVHARNFQFYWLDS